MKIRGWWCPTEGIEVPLDHYESGACADEPMPAEWIMAIYDQNAGDTTHADLQVTATRMMACPRKVAIEDGIPSAPDPMALNAMFQGTVRHYYMQHKTRAGSYKEVVFPPEGHPPVKFLGALIYRATVDNATADLACIKDYKTGSEASHNFTFSRGCPPEEQAQASIYRIVMERSMPGERERPRRTSIRGAGCFSSKASDRMPRCVRCLRRRDLMAHARGLILRVLRA